MMVYIYIYKSPFEKAPLKVLAFFDLFIYIYILHIFFCVCLACRLKALVIYIHACPTGLESRAMRLTEVIPSPLLTQFLAKRHPRLSRGEHLPRN